MFCHLACITRIALQEVESSALLAAGAAAAAGVQRQGAAAAAVGRCARAGAQGSRQRWRGSRGGRWLCLLVTSLRCSFVHLQGLFRGVKQPKCTCLPFRALRCVLIYPAGAMFLSEVHARLFAVLNSYRDVTLPTRSYPNRCRGDKLACSCIDSCF